MILTKFPPKWIYFLFNIMIYCTNNAIIIQIVVPTRVLWVTCCLYLSVQFRDLNPHFCNNIYPPGCREWSIDIVILLNFVPFLSYPWPAIVLVQICFKIPAICNIYRYSCVNEFMKIHQSCFLVAISYSNADRFYTKLINLPIFMIAGASLIYVENKSWEFSILFDETKKYKQFFYCYVKNSQILLALQLLYINLFKCLIRVLHH